MILHFQTLANSKIIQTFFLTVPWSLERLTPKSRYLKSSIMNQWNDNFFVQFKMLQNRSKIWSRFGVPNIQLPIYTHFRILPFIILFIHIRRYVSAMHPFNIKLWLKTDKIWVNFIRKYWMEKYDQWMISTYSFYVILSIQFKLKHFCTIKILALFKDVIFLFSEYQMNDKLWIAYVYIVRSFHALVYIIMWERMLK